MEKIHVETLLELKEYNKKLLIASENIVEFLRRQREDQALDLFVSAIDGFSWILEVISYTKCFLEEYGFSENLENINVILKEMIEGLQNQDYVLLADLLEYEMIIFLEHTQSTLEKMNIKETLSN